MRSRYILITLCTLALAISCRGPEPLDPGQDAPATSDDPNATELRLGQSQLRPIAVPLGYSLVDINGNGDLLLGDTWLPQGAPHPVPLPFIGRAISDSQQVLGYGLFYFEHGTVSGFPSPCSPITREGYYWDCSDPAELIAQGPNGDILATWRQDAPGTGFSPYHSAAVWRVGTGAWEPLFSIFGDGPYITGILSESGTVALNVDNAPDPDQGLVRTRQGSFSLSLAGACPPSSPDPMSLDLRSVNDVGEVVGSVVCLIGDEFVARGVRWSRFGGPSPVDGIPAAIDNFGNIAGTRTDGRAVIWLAGGRVIDLSRDVGQPISVRKFLRAGSLFAYFGTQPAVWRFGYRCHRWTGPLC